MPAKILTLNASPVIFPSEEYLNKVKNGATPNQYEQLTSKIVKPAVRGAFQALSRNENTQPNYTEILGRAISVLTFGNSTNILDPISALLIPMNRALYAVNRGGDLLHNHFLGFTKEDLEKSAAFGKRIMPKLQELGEILGFTLTENTNTGQFVFNKNQDASPILDNTGSPIYKEKLIVPAPKPPIYLFNADEKFALNTETQILDQFDKLIAEIRKAAGNPQKDAEIKGVREEGGGLKPRDFWLGDRITIVGPITEVGHNNTLSLSHVPIDQIKYQAAYIANTKEYYQDVGPDTPFDEVLANVGKISVMGPGVEHIPSLNEEYAGSQISFGVNPKDGYFCYRCQSYDSARNLAQ
ncbi:MAG: hypothetical protein ACKO3R_11095 [bacterium]